MITQPVRAKVDKVFEKFTLPGSPGCALGVMKDGEFVYKQGYGLANLEYDIPITPSTIFHVASISKQFTALAVALLVDAGKVSLDDDVRKYLPEVPNFGETITLRHLIHHTSGLRSDLMLLIAAGWRLEDVITNVDVMDLVKRQQGLNFRPGEKFAYGGVGYLLLALIVERVSGQSFAQFCKERIFEPLGMTNTRFYDDYLQVVKNRAYAYYADGDNHYKNAVLTCALVGGTGLFTTIEDLALWDENFYTAQVGDQSVIAQMHQRGFLNNGEEIEYAFGLVVDTYKGRPVIEHGGDGAGIHSYMMRFPEEHFSVAVLGNYSAINARQLARQVADIYLDDMLEETTDTGAGVPETIELEQTQLFQKAGKYYDQESVTFVDIEFRNGKLCYRGYDLAPVSENNFIFAAFPQATVDFILATETGSAQVQINTGTGSTYYQRVEPITATLDYLGTYAGNYYSPELDVTWVLAMEDDKLTVQRKRQGRSLLMPMTADVFTDDWVGAIIHTSGKHALAFERNEDNAVVGFRLSDAGGSARNLRFVKKGTSWL